MSSLRQTDEKYQDASVSKGIDLMLKLVVKEF